MSTPLVPRTISVSPSGVHLRTVWSLSSVRYKESSGPMWSPCGRVNWPSPQDRRVKIVELTDVGRATCQALVRLSEELPTALLDVPEADLRELARIASEVLRRSRV